MGKARKALKALRDGMLANDKTMDGDNQSRGSRSPNGNDYNVLFDLVLDACLEAEVEVNYCPMCQYAGPCTTCPNCVTPTVANFGR